MKSRPEYDGDEKKFYLKKNLGRIFDSDIFYFLFWGKWAGKKCKKLFLTKFNKYDSYVNLCNDLQ